MPRDRNEFQWPELQPAFEDFAQATSSGSADAMQSTASGKVFLVPKDFQMPPELNFTASNLSKIGRKAGALSNYESAAATAWVKHNAHNSFACAPLAWSGRSSLHLADYTLSFNDRIHSVLLAVRPNPVQALR